MERYLHLLSRGDKIGLTLIRLSIAIVFMWIGLLKFVPYEADSITPFVANSPLMSFFYEHPEDYKQHLTHEGEYKPEARAWQTANNTYGFSNGLGVVEVIIRCWSSGIERYSDAGRCCHDNGRFGAGYS